MRARGRRRRLCRPLGRPCGDGQRRAQRQDADGADRHDEGPLLPAHWHLRQRRSRAEPVNEHERSKSKATHTNSTATTEPATASGIGTGHFTDPSRQWIAGRGILIGWTPRGWRRPGAPRPTFMRASPTSRPRRRPRFLTEKLGLEEIPQRPRRFGVKGPAGREHELRRAGERVDAGRVPSHNRGAGRAEAQGGSVA